jgi:hypothetical protein
VLNGCAKKNVPNSETEEISITPVPTTPGIQTITPSVTEPIPQVTKDSLKIADFYPFKENVKYVYAGKGNEYASYSVYTDYVADNRAQFRINNGGSEQVKVLENTNGTLIIHLSRGETYFRENFVDKTDGNDEILLKEPLVKGTEWTLPDNRKRYISNVDVKITTPYGTFNTIEVITEGDATPNKNIDYYAIEIGLVKTIYSSAANEVSSELSKIEKNSPLTQTIMFYYPNVKEGVIYAVEKKISFQTNDITRIRLQEAFNELAKDKFDPVLNTNTKINSLYLSNENIVSVDFSQELIADMNKNLNYEAMVLQCITNTLGNYYGVNQVYITVEGNPYHSDNITLAKNETFKVNLENVIQ